MKMIIQPLLFSHFFLSNEQELFFRGVNSQETIKDKFIIRAGKTISLETYFNSFSIGKWLKYTKLDNLYLYLSIQGNAEIKAFHAVGAIDTKVGKIGQALYSENELVAFINSKGYSAQREEITITVKKTKSDYIVNFNKLFSEGIIYITIKALEDITFYGGYYATNIDKTLFNPVKIAIGICTFKREKEIVNNVSRLLNEVAIPDSPLKNKLEVYIADNGQTIDKEAFCSNIVHVLPNQNLGGAGGFTRTMIEAMIYDKKKSFTHIIFMDDDIVLYPAIIFRTYYFLCLLKPVFKKAIIGASMFLEDKPFLQQNCGSLSKNELVAPSLPNHHFFDLRKQDAVAANEVMTPINYTGWFFTCIPATIVSKNNLPMPFFLHNDDVEFGLRNNVGGLILLNGIGIWHPRIENKGAPWITYYDTRNRFIVVFMNSISKKDLKQHLSQLTKKILLGMIRYDYQSAQLIIHAIEDLLKTPDYFIHLNALKKQKELSEYGCSLVKPDEIGLQEIDIVSKRFYNLKIAFLIQLFCNILPARKKIRAIDINYYNIPYCSNQFYIYNPAIGKGRLLTRNNKKFFGLFLRFFNLKNKILRNYKNLLDDWQAAKPILTSLPFWEKYLGLKHKE